ncbi:MAG: SDR family oxidoreductase [Verrucomicrobia bacterium]|nr:SDR family oxidoreductase [Verrucomicrobiota bacterium]
MAGAQRTAGLPTRQPVKSPERRVIVITGVTRGLGRALVDECVRAGHTVVGCGRDAGAVAELTSRFPGPHAFRALDVTAEPQVAAWAAEVEARKLVPDLLINNAAVIARTAPLWELSAAEFDRVVDVNLKGVANVIRHFLPPMLARRRGVVVNLSSGWGRSTDRGVAVYCATKWGIEGLTRALAQELPPGMAAVPLNPGIINTDMLRSCFGDSARDYPSPEAWARRAAPFLLSLGAKHNGQALTVP